VTNDNEFQRALAALQAGNVKEAENLFKATLRKQPRHVGALNLLGIVLTKLGRFADAENYLRLASSENANSDSTLYNYGIVLKALNRPHDALERFSQALKINTSDAETWNNRGTVFNELTRFDEAIADFERAIQLSPRYAEAFYNKGNALTMLRRFDEALAAYDKALALKPDLAAAWLGRGNVFASLRRSDDAFAAYDRALALDRVLAGAWLGRGNVLRELKRYDDALTAYNTALALKPDLAEVWLGRGNVYVDLNRYDDALTAYERALALKPDLAGAWLGCGNVFIGLMRYDTSLAAYDKALAVKPDLAEAWFGRGAALAALSRHDEAFAAYDKALAVEPDSDYAPDTRLLAKLSLCDWNNLQTETAQLLSMIRKRIPARMPSSLLAVSSSAEDQLQCAQRQAQDRAIFPPIWRGEVYSHSRIRVAYLSADFHEHPVAHLTAGLFEHHDKLRFETMALSLGIDRASSTRDRIKGAVEHFIDAGSQSDQDIAELIRRREIDIVIDLMGLTSHNRLAVLARRPAPIQVNYLGYSGTTGADYVDYILADATVIPEQQCAFYSEQVIWLPDCYLVNDDRRPISKRTPSRGECRLPEDGVVFCCFNNTYKLMPETFRIWMRLLNSTLGSVLWLSAANPTAQANLRREAERCGVSAQRLIFAPRMPDVADHLARQRQANLFLDTLPYNAHTTTCDALWAGLPVLTCLGTTFAGRVAGSLLKAVGLDELVTTSLEDYEALALKLAHDPAALASVRDKLARSRTTFPLFDTERTTRQIEAAYTTIWERYQRGEMPKRPRDKGNPILIA
jgi:protein O-GlcNAc transferase